MTTSLIARRVRAGGAWHAPCVPVFLLLAALARTAHAADNPELQTIVISATRIPTPVLEVASSMTVVTAADIEARQERTFADVLKDVPGLNVVQTGGPGGVDLGVHARHELQPYEGAARWDRSVGPEQFHRRVRLRAAAHAGHRARRGAARAAERPVRLGCHRRGDQHHHQGGQWPGAVQGPDRRRQLRHLQPGRHAQRLAGWLPLQRERRALPRRLRAGDAARAAADAHPRHRA